MRGYLGLRIRSQIAVFISVLTLAALLSQIDEIRLQNGTGPGGWWLDGLASALGGVAAATVLGALLRRQRAAVAGAALQLGLFALLVATWPLAWDGTPHEAAMLWFVAFGGGTLLLLPTFLRGVPLWAAFIVLHGGSLVENAVSSPHGIAAARLTDVAFGLVYMGVFVLLEQTVVAVADRVDVEAAREAGPRAEKAAERARAAQAALLDGVIHDRVLGVLGAVDRLGPSAATRRAARRALTVLRALSGGAGTPRPVTEAELVDRLVDAARDAGAFVEPPTEVDDGARRRAHPGGVASELVDAATEVLANARAHGGPAVTVGITAHPERGVEVTVRDDGPGFDVGAAMARGGGLRVSVVGRVEAVGGTAVVHSDAGAGTRITLALPPGAAPRQEARPDGRRRGLFGVAPLDARLRRLLGVLFACVLTVDAVSALLVGERAPGALVAQVGIGLAGALVVIRDAWSTGTGWALAGATSAVAAAGLLVSFERGGPEFVYLVEAPMWVLGVLLLRGYRRAAWTGAVAVSAVYLTTLLGQGLEPSEAVGRVVIGLFIVVGAQVFDVVVVPIRRTEDELRRQAVEGRVAGAAATAAIAERRARAQRILDGVGDLLGRIASADHDDRALRDEARIAEAGLRDHLRARGLLDARIDAAVGRARLRGAHVQLLDDSAGSLDDAVAARARDRLAEELDVAGPGTRIVARLQPGDSPTVFGMRTQRPDGTVHRTAIAREDPAADGPERPALGG